MIDLALLRARISIHRLSVDRHGGVVISFAIVLVPLLLAIGGAIDFSRAHIVKTRLQGAIDAAVLSAASNIERKNKERIKTAKKIFAANYPASELGVPAKPKIKLGDDGSVTGVVKAKVGTTLLSVIGMKKLKVRAEAAVQSGRLLQGEVVLVLDYSSSMDGGGKYQAMRSAAKDLIKTLSRDGTIPTIKFGLVPFARHVYGSLESKYIINEAAGGIWTNCTQDRRWPHNTRDVTPLLGDDSTKWGLAGGGSPYSSCGNYPSRSLVIRPLTNDHSGTLSQLTDMEPYSGTHISLGLEFGWHVLSPNAPWTEGENYNKPNYIKSIVLLTDGEQTVSAWGPGNSSSSANGEDNLEDMCTSIKDENVLLVTVAFDLDDSATETRLRNCATSPSYYFDADNNAELAAAFKAIARKFAGQLHLSK